MEQFIKASEAKALLESVNQGKIDIFIKRFNQAVKTPKTDTTDTFYLNDALSNLPALNAAELKECTRQALEAGWELTSSEDNYQSITYHLKIIK